MNMGVKIQVTQIRIERGPCGVSCLWNAIIEHMSNWINVKDEQENAYEIMDETNDNLQFCKQE